MQDTYLTVLGALKDVARDDAQRCLKSRCVIITLLEGRKFTKVLQLLRFFKRQNSHEQHRISGTRRLCGKPHVHAESINLGRFHSGTMEGEKVSPAIVQ